MRLFGLIGYPLSHSFSEEYFRNKFINEQITDCEYRTFPIETLTHLPHLLEKHKNLCGLNVTIPYKEKIISYLHEIDETAEQVRAVNVVKILNAKSNFYLKGYNTDIIGFEETLKPLLKPYHTKALVLGTGGASKAVIYVLRKLGIGFTFISREPKDKSHLAYHSVDRSIITDHLLIINTTPSGMYPDTDQCPLIPYEAVTEKHILYDLIYNPSETVFLKKGKEKNAIIFNGLPMLCIQAEAAWKIWNS